jgi:hypothetical protein
VLKQQENFEENKSYLRKRAEEERNPVVRKLLERDQNFLDRIEKSLKEQGFSASRAGAGTLSGSWLCITSRT